MPDTAGLGELWIRVSRLAESCSICLEVVAVPPGWRVQISHKGPPQGEVHGHGDHVIEALAMAVNRAESLGLSGRKG